MEVQGRDTVRASGGAHLTYLPGLDGLRALAVLAVLAYHGGVGVFPAGFLGVEVFLVLSGYLITALLVRERADTGRISLAAFWWRRARRLLPALFLLLVVVAVVSVLFVPEQVAGLRGDTVAAVFYVQNWYQVFTEQSYFEAVGRPPLLRHLWSLAVEEQFYLVWPLVFAAGIRLFGRQRLLIGVLAGALGSTVLMAVLFNPAVDPTRVYYGTDTRASGLLLGVALALVWQPWRLRPDVPAPARAALDGAGALALVGLGVVMATYSEFSAWLYRGGFAITGVLTVVVIAALVHPAARIGAVVGVAPLRWIGKRSYGIYLWHWPVFMLTRPDADVTWPGWVLVAVRLVLTFGIAELSFRYVEMPVRNGALGRLWARVRRPETTGDVFLRRRVAVGSLAATLVAVPVVWSVVRAEPPGPPPWLVTATAGTQPLAGASGVLAFLPPSVVGAMAASAATEAELAAARAVGVPGRVTVLGDSVLLGASTEVIDAVGAVRGGEVFPDAAVSRQVDDGIALLRLWRDSGTLGQTVVVHLGNNGVFTDGQFDEMMDILDGVPEVVFITTSNGYRWQDPVNQTLVRGAERHPQVELVDWKAVSGESLDDRVPVFWDDQMHVRPEGAQVYARMLANALR